MSGHQIIKKGPVIGQYENRSIHDFLVYDDNQVIRFSHVAPVERDGSIYLSIMSDEEVLVSPGLVYRRDVCAEPGCLTEHQMTT